MLARLCLLLLPFAAPLCAQCRLCVSGETSRPSEAARPLTIEVETALDLGRAAVVTGGGSIAIDERSGVRRVEGLADLGGQAIKGRVRLTGEPFRHVRVSLPTSVRLVAPDGGSAEAVDIRTDLPPDPALDASGTLSFGFGGRLLVGTAASGNLRGRIPITADYQ